MVSFNRVILAGNLTRDPELKFTQSGIPVCDFGLAVNRRKREGEDEAHFFDISAWRELGENVANYKKKGDPVLVEGRLQFRSWEAQDGSKRNKVDVVADRVEFLSGRSDGGEGGGGQRSGASSGGGQRASNQNRNDVDINEEDFDDIPF